jgi:hypothetical protein
MAGREPAQPFTNITPAVFDGAGLVFLQPAFPSRDNDNKANNTFFIKETDFN